MKTIAFVTTPLYSGDAIRGVGFYTKRLLEPLKKHAKSFGFEISEIKNSQDLTNKSFDLIHYPYFTPFRHSLPFINHKTVVTIHDVIPLEFPEVYPAGIKGFIGLQLQKISLLSIDRVITDSQASVNAIHRYLGVPHNKLKLVYLAADKSFKKVSNPKNKFDLPKKFVLYVGDINYNKNIPNLVKACKLANFPLVIVGKQAANIGELKIRPSIFNPRDVFRSLLGQTHPQLRHLKDLEKLFVENSIIRLGFVEDRDLVDIYNLATVYCQPSLAEGFGLPVLEALACGTAVACSKTSSLPELAGECATYFDPNDVSDIAEALKKAKPVNAEIQLDKFSWEKAADETLQVYKEVLE